MFLFIVYIVTVYCRFLLSFVYLLKIFGLNWTVVCFISVLLLVVFNATCIHLTVDFYITAKFFKSCEFFVTTELLYTYPWNYYNFMGVTSLLFYYYSYMSAFLIYRFNTFSSSYIHIIKHHIILFKWFISLRRHSKFGLNWL